MPGNTRPDRANVYRIGRRTRCSRSHYDRCARLDRRLRAGDIRSSRDIRALEACERLFNRAHGAGDVPAGRGLNANSPAPRSGCLCAAPVFTVCVIAAVRLVF